jgi:hypothetical protein
MLTDFQTFILSSISYLAYYCVLYVGVCSLVYASNPAYPTQNNLDSSNPPAQEPLSTVSDPVLQADTSGVAESDKESALALPTHGDSVKLDKFDDTPVPYKHEFWPSPRPVNFVRAILDDDPGFKVSGRLAHVKAVDILAERAFMSRKEFLRTNPISYSQRFMKGINSLYLLKDSIDRLEYLLREETYKQELRRIENGKNRCPIY